MTKSNILFQVTIQDIKWYFDLHSTLLNKMTEVKPKLIFWT